MIDKFRTYIKEQQLIGKNSRLLLAVSGGVDSSVMVHLFRQEPYEFGIAHCNFGLRGKESDEDEQFVQQLALKAGVEFHHKSFDTEDYASANSMSIQEAARKLRYAWFARLSSENQYDYVVTAHHADDLAETILLNLTRGTGIAGLHGILPRRGKIIRPLLFASRAQIEKYASDNSIEFRVDRSNSDLKYARNLIRNNVMPELKKLNPSVVDTISRHAGVITDIEAILDQYCDDFVSRNKIRNEKGEEVIINIRELLISPGARYILYRLLSQFGFNATLCADIYRALNTSKTGEVFYSSSYKAIHDRDELIIQRAGASTDERIYEVEKDDDGMLMRYGSIEVSRIELPDGTTWEEHLDLSNSEVAYLDESKIDFPLKVRTWKNGDQFRPLGMKGNKLLSDFYTDLKVPVYVKSKTYLVISGEDIIWVAGLRINDRYKLKGSTKTALKLRFINLH